jgi:DNA-binding NarL/FixJ family response regulator
VKPRYEIEQDGEDFYLLVRIPIDGQPKRITFDVPSEWLKTGSFTRREEQVTEMLCQGKSNKEIATALNVSLHTAKFHVARVMQKTGRTSRVDFLKLAN